MQQTAQAILFQLVTREGMLSSSLQVYALSCACDFMRWTISSCARYCIVPHCCNIAKVVVNLNEAEETCSKIYHIVAATLTHCSTTNVAEVLPEICQSQFSQHMPVAP